MLMKNRESPNGVDFRANAICSISKTALDIFIIKGLECRSYCNSSHQQSRDTVEFGKSIGGGSSSSAAAEALQTWRYHDIIIELDQLLTILK